MANEIGTREDMIMRLDNTVCMYKDEPVFVIARDPDLVRNCVYLINLKDGKALGSVNITSDDFCYSSIKLGYVNYRNHAMYLLRTPIRRQKQGVHLDNLRAAGGDFIISTSLLKSGSFRNMVKNEYPSFQSCVRRLLLGKVASIATTKNLAMKLDGEYLVLMYKGEPVAKTTEHIINQERPNFQINFRSGGESFIERVLARENLYGEDYE